MATNDNLNISASGIVVYDGAGTFSADTVTQNSVLTGGASNAITSLGIGGTGTLLVGSVGADAAFASSANGDFTFTSATSGQKRTLTVSNSSNTSNSIATVLISTAGTLAASPTIQLTNTSKIWTLGTNNADSHALVLSQHYS